MAKARSLSRNASPVSARLWGWSHINAGRQSLPENLSELACGVSLTDGCIGWEHTERGLGALRRKLKDGLPGRRTGAG